jgi:TetR/AcrR family transcriptional regulator, lmrAB and yxaGH operons repressor
MHPVIAMKTREKMIVSASLLMRKQGLEATSFSQVLETSGAPRGSIYHHFPNGKVQLAAEAAALDGVRTREAIEESLAERGMKGTLRLFADFFRRRSADHPELIGCPVAAAALARPEDPELAAVATAAFKSWEEPIAEALEADGVGHGDAIAFAALAVSTIEGALLRTRAAASHEPLDLAVTALETALDGLLARSP